MQLDWRMGREGSERHRLRAADVVGTDERVGKLRNGLRSPIGIAIMFGQVDQFVRVNGEVKELLEPIAIARVPTEITDHRSRLQRHQLAAPFDRRKVIFDQDSVADRCRWVVKDRSKAVALDSLVCAHLAEIENGLREIETGRQ